MDIIQYIVDEIVNKNNVGLFLFSTMAAVWLIKTFIVPIKRFYSSLVKKKDITVISENIADKITELERYEDNFLIDIKAKLETIENMISSLEQTSKTNNIDVDILRRDVDLIKTYLKEVK